MKKAINYILLPLYLLWHAVMDRFTVKDNVVLLDDKQIQGAVEVDNIQAVSDDILNKLKVGDVVRKKTSDMKHCYVVSYKEENHGICLSYFAAGYTETVSYDYVGGHWVYNSTDVVPITVLNPDNVPLGELSEELGFDSNGVLKRGNASGGSGGEMMYRHVITLETEYKIDGVSNYAYLGFEIMDTSAIAYTKASLVTSYVGKSFISTGNVIGSNLVDPSSHRSGILKFEVGAQTGNWSGINSNNVLWQFYVSRVFYDSVAPVGIVGTSVDTNDFVYDNSLLKLKNKYLQIVELTGDEKLVDLLSAYGQAFIYKGQSVTYYVGLALAYGDYYDFEIHRAKNIGSSYYRGTVNKNTTIANCIDSTYEKSYLVPKELTDDSGSAVTKLIGVDTNNTPFLVPVPSGGSKIYQHYIIITSPSLTLALYSTSPTPITNKSQIKNLINGPFQGIIRLLDFYGNINIISGVKREEGQTTLFYINQSGGVSSTSVIYDGTAGLTDSVSEV